MIDGVCEQVGNFYDMEDCFWRNGTQYRSYYKMKILGYLDLTCCVILIISNAFVIMIFSRKSVISSMNTIFTHIAITESLASLSYIPRAWHEFFRVEECEIPRHRTYIWEEISVLSYITAFMFRHIGVWLAVMLGLWRYIAVIHPLKERCWCNSEITRKFIKLGYAFGVISTILAYFIVEVGPVNKLLDENGCSTLNNTIGNYTPIYEWRIAFENYGVFIFSFFFASALLKLLPSVAFTFISYRLIIRLIEVKKQRKSMISQQLDNSTDRTTIVLVVILTLFVVGEVPQAIFCMLTAYHGPSFFWRFYYYGFEVCNTLTHLSESFNFIIYYAMSQQFRETFKSMIRRNTIFNSCA